MQDMVQVNSSQGCNQSINHEIIHESTNAMREREIVRKGIGRLEKQINQLLATKIPMDKSDIALINKLKVVDVPSLNSASTTSKRRCRNMSNSLVQITSTAMSYLNLWIRLIAGAYKWNLHTMKQRFTP